MSHSTRCLARVLLYLFGPHVNYFDYQLFLSWHPLMASVCAAEGDTRYLMSDSFGR
jgi:hypothetical protein